MKEDKLIKWLKDQIQSEINWSHETEGRDIRSDAKIEAYVNVIEKITSKRPIIEWKVKPTRQELKEADDYAKLFKLAIKYGYKTAWADKIYESRINRS